MAVIKPISFAARGVVALEKTHLSVFLHCGTQVFFVRYQSCQCSTCFSNYVATHSHILPVRVVGVPGERAQGAAPKV